MLLYIRLFWDCKKAKIKSTSSIIFVYFCSTTELKPNAPAEYFIMAKKIAIIGLGWLGLPLATSLTEKGYLINGSTRSSEKLMSLLKSGIIVKVIDIQNHGIKGKIASLLKEMEIVVIGIPPGKDKHYAYRLNHLIKHIPEGTKVIFISSTSVYGNPDELVTEEFPTEPETESAKSIVEAEYMFQLNFGADLTIVRFAGLFGPNRHPGRFMNPNRKISRPQGVVNMIHQRDCLTLLTAIIEQDKFGYIINGCADQHPKRIEFYQKAAYELSLTPPAFDMEDETTGKTVCNKLSKSLLGMNYHCPNPMDWL